MCVLNLIKTTYFLLFQLGIALGFLLPPLLVKNSDNMDVIAAGLSLMFYSIAIFNSILLLIILLCEYLLWLVLVPLVFTVMTGG